MKLESALAVRFAKLFAVIAVLAGTVAPTVAEAPTPARWYCLMFGLVCPGPPAPPTV
jgi:poly(3-hydroxybutyrate) depolymerase